MSCRHGRREFSAPGGRGFVDRSLGAQQIAAALREAGASVVVHDDEFAKDTPDEVWLKEAGRRGWLVVSKDKRIATRTLELLAIARAGARVFILGAGNMTYIPHFAKLLTANFTAAVGTLRQACPGAVVLGVAGRLAPGERPARCDHRPGGRCPPCG